MIRLAPSLWATAGLACVLALGSLGPRSPRLLWNTTASAPLGLYGLSWCAAPRVGEWVVARPEPRVAAWLARAGYLPRHVPLLKRVAAAPRQQVCRSGAGVTVDARLVAFARARGRNGLLLPSWEGCRRLRAGELFLLNTPADSLDGRYLGVTRNADLIGRATPLWTWRAR